MSDPYRAHVDAGHARATHINIVLVLTYRVHDIPDAAIAYRRVERLYAHVLMPLTAFPFVRLRDVRASEPHLWDGSPFADDRGGVVWIAGDTLRATGTLSHLDGDRVEWPALSPDPELAAILAQVASRDRLAVKRLCDKTRSVVAEELKECLGPYGCVNGEPHTDTIPLALRAARRALDIEIEDNTRATIVARVLVSTRRLDDEEEA